MGSSQLNMASFLYLKSKQNSNNNEGIDRKEIIYLMMTIRQNSKQLNNYK